MHVLLSCPATGRNTILAKAGWGDHSGRRTRTGQGFMTDIAPRAEPAATAGRPQCRTDSARRAGWHTSKDSPPALCTISSADWLSATPAAQGRRSLHLSAPVQLSWNQLGASQCSTVTTAQAPALWQKLPRDRAACGAPRATKVVGGTEGIPRGTLRRRELTHGTRRSTATPAAIIVTRNPAIPFRHPTRRSVRRGPTPT